MNDSNRIDSPDKSYTNPKVYTIGFIVSIVLTLISFFLVAEHVFERAALITTIVVLALIQAVVQLVIFLNLGAESKPRWKLITFLFMLLVLVIIAFGSLWIMFNLDERTMPSMETKETSIFNQQ